MKTMVGSRQPGEIVVLRMLGPEFEMMDSDDSAVASSTLHAVSIHIFFYHKLLPPLATNLKELNKICQISGLKERTIILTSNAYYEV